MASKDILKASGVGVTKAAITTIIKKISFLYLPSFKGFIILAIDKKHMNKGNSKINPKARTKKLKKLTKCPREIAGSIFSVLKEIRNFIPYGRVTS